MNLKAYLIKSENGALLFDVDGFVPELEENKPYKLTIKPYKTARSLEQNAMLWGIMQQIADYTKNDVMDIYISALENADCKSEFILVMPEIIDELKKVFRAVKIMEYRTHNNAKTNQDVQVAVVKAWIGSSKFNTLEMKKLIDYVINLAEELGLNVDER